MGMLGSNPEDRADFEDHSIESLSQSALEAKKSSKRRGSSEPEYEDVRNYQEKSKEEIKALALMESDAAKKIDLSEPLFKRVDLPDGRIEMVADLSDFVRAAKELNFVEHSEELERLYRSDFDDAESARSQQLKDYLQEKGEQGLSPDMEEMRSLNLIDKSMTEDQFAEAVGAPGTGKIQSGRSEIGQSAKTEADRLNDHKEYEEYVRGLREKLNQMGIIKLALSLWAMLALVVFGRILKLATGGKIGELKTDFFEDALLMRTKPMSRDEWEKRYNTPEFEKINTKKDFYSAFLEANKFSASKYERFGVVSPVMLRAVVSEQKEALSKTYAQLGDLCQEIPGWERLLKKHESDLKKMQGEGASFSEKEALGRVIMHCDETFLSKNAKKLEKSVVFRDIEAKLSGNKDAKPDLKNVIDVITNNFQVIRSNLGYSLAKSTRTMYEEMPAEDRPSADVMMQNTSNWSYAQRVALQDDIRSLLFDMTPKGEMSALSVLEDMNERIRESYRKESERLQKASKKNSSSKDAAAKAEGVDAQISEKKGGSEAPKIAAAAGAGVIAINNVAAGTAVDASASTRAVLKATSVLDRFRNAPDVRQTLTADDRLKELEVTERSRDTIKTSRKFAENLFLKGEEAPDLDKLWGLEVTSALARSQPSPGKHIDLNWGEYLHEDLKEKIATLIASHENKTELKAGFVDECNHLIDDFIRDLTKSQDEFSEIVNRISNAGIKEPNEWKAKLIGYCRNADAVADLQQLLGHDDILPTRDALFNKDIVAETPIIHSEEENIPQDQIDAYELAKSEGRFDNAPKYSHG